MHYRGLFAGFDGDLVFVSLERTFAFAGLGPLLELEFATALALAFAALFAFEALEFWGPT